jgi:23S rRNA (uracil1939-C5)-methyltransferase
VAALAYERQVAWKHAKVVRALEGVLPAAQILPCVPSPITLGYRNQAKLTYGRDAAGRALLGAYAPRSHQVVDVAGCKLIEAPLEAVANTIRAHLAHRGVRPHEAQVPGDLRHVVLRANGAGQVLVTLVAAHANPAVARLAEGIMGTHVEVTGVVLNLNPDPGDVIFGGEEQVLAGTGHVNDRIVGVPVKLSSRAFFQINRQVAALVYEAVDSLARAHGRFEVAVEVYAGAGIIAQKLAAHAPRVVAIEDNPSSGVALGDAGAALEYLAADAAVGLSALKRADLVVLNPPRGGCDPAVLAQMARLRPRVVAYLSCNPTTLARDLTTLNGLGVGPGMGTSTVRPFDMLPHTSHVEVLTFFTSV